MTARSSRTGGGGTRPSGSRSAASSRIPNRGYFVPDSTDKDVDELYSLRLLLEIGGVRHAIDRLTEQGIAELQRTLDDVGEAMRQKSDTEKLVALDLSFHDFIFGKADRSRLYSVWRRMRFQM